MEPLKIYRPKLLERSESGVSSAHKFSKNQNHPGVMKKIGKKPEPKREFSENAKRLIAKLRFRVKLYLCFNKARQAIDDHNDALNPNYKYLVKILRNPYRSNENASRILEYIKPFPFFAKFINDLGDLGTEAIIQLCKHIKHEYIPAATCIFKEGDPSNDKFYVIIKGSVSIVKKVDKNVFQEENERNQRRSRVLESAPQIPDSVIIDTVQDKAYAFEKELENVIAAHGVKLKDMKEGEGFGEKALIEKGTKRTTSVVTNSNCEFIVIMKNDYMGIIRKYDKRHQIKTDFMKTKIPFLSTINSPVIWEDIYYLIKDVDRPKGSILANENEKGNKIFFIVSGYCEIEKNIVVEFTDNHSQYDPIRFKRAIAKFNAGSCLGEEILVSNTQTYDYTIRVESTTANICYVERDGFLKRFPPDTIRAILQNYLVKETVHKQKILKLQEEAKESLQSKASNQLNLKTNQILRCFNTPSRAKIARQIQFSQSKEIEVQEKTQFALPLDMIGDEIDTEGSPDASNFFEIKNKLDGFLRNAVQSKPKTPQLPKLMTQSPKVSKPASLQSSPLNVSASKFSTKLGKDEIIPISSNPEHNIKFRLAYKRVDAVDQPDQNRYDEVLGPNEKLDLKSKKFDFGNSYAHRYVDRNRKVSTSYQGTRPTPTQKIMAILQRNFEDRTAEGHVKEKSSERINYHLDGGFPMRRTSRLSAGKYGVTREGSIIINDNSRLERTNGGEDHALLRQLQNFQSQTSLNKKRSLLSLKRDEQSAEQNGISQINIESSPTQEMSRFIMTTMTPSNKVSVRNSAGRSKSKVLDCFSP